MNGLLEELACHGFRARTVSADHAPELKAEIEERHRRGEFAEEFYRERLLDIRSSFNDAEPEIRTLIVVAAPQPIIRLIFHLPVKPVTLVVPPTYQYGVNEKAERLLKKCLKRAGCRLIRTSLPLKLLAARSGLGVYGRNNVCYVKGLGSFHRLMAFGTDLPWEEDSWGPARLMDTCSRCRACRRLCPTGAIQEEDLLLRAHRCLTFLNERSDPFPQWTDSSWHHAVVGCLHCQLVCPENKTVRNWSQAGDKFSEEETRLLLEGRRPEKIPADLRGRLERLGLLEYSEILPRNIQAALANSASSADSLLEEYA